jgi:organic hydroperoxide reductase OsmC/OhrA
VLISATVMNSQARNEVSLRTGECTQSLVLPTKLSGKGSAVNGGEFLMLALATCYCNDFYREAERLNVPVEGILVEATADFPGVGLAASNIRYKVKVSSPAPPETSRTWCGKRMRSQKFTTPSARVLPSLF